jgi:broad specificity phosphatase PhoE
MTLIFVRHGQAQSNATGVIGGWRDYPLTDLGREQARAAARRLAALPTAAVYASDLSRASETARLIAEPLGLEVIEHAALRERGWGDAEGLTREEINARWPGAPRGKGLITNEETHDAFLERLTPLFRELHARHREDRAIVVAHAGTILSLIGLVMDLPSGRRPRISIANTSLTTIEGTEPPSFGSINDFAHL